MWAYIGRLTHRRESMRYPFAVTALILLLFSGYAGAQDVESINGEWSGSGHQTPVGATGLKHQAIAMTISGNGGTVGYPDLHCGGRIARVGAGGTSGIFREHIIYGADKCTDGATITVHVHDGQLDWAWSGSSGDSVVAVLTRSQ